MVTNVLWQNVFFTRKLDYEVDNILLYRRKLKLIHKSNKVLYKLDMNYFPLCYHILNRTHTKKKH